MRHTSIQLLADAEAFLSKTGMGDAYFGKAACGNSELMTRLRNGGRVWPETEEKVREFMKERSSATAAPASEAASQ